MLIKTDKRSDYQIWYQKFRELYQFDALGYFVSFLGGNPSLDQINYLKDVSEPGGKYAYSSGHHTGKSYIGGATVNWLLHCYPESHTILGADKVTKIKATIWKEVHRFKSIIDKKHPFLKKVFILTDERYYKAGEKMSWFVEMKATGDINKADTNFSGLHAKWLTIILDEVSGIDDKVFDPIDGTLTKTTNRLILFSQRTKNTGRMHDAFGKLKKQYTTRVFNTEHSPHVEIDEIKAYRDTFGGRHTDQYSIRVLGGEAVTASGMLMSRVWAEECATREHSNFNRDRKDPNYPFGFKHVTQPGLVISSDVSGGGYRANSTIFVARVSGEFEKRVVELLEMNVYRLDDNLKPLQLAKRIAQFYWRPEYGTATIIVDKNGLGWGTCEKLEDELEVPHHGLLWGEPSFEYKRFKDLKTEGYFYYKESTVNKNIAFIPNHPHNELLFEQTDKLPFDFEGNKWGAMRMIPKKEMAKLNIPSPDLTDTLAQIYLSDYSPQPMSDQDMGFEDQIRQETDFSWRKK